MGPRAGSVDVSGFDQSGVRIRPWAERDWPLIVRLLGDAEMMRYLGGPETEEKLRERQARYVAHSEGGVFAIVLGESDEGVGWVGYWESEWEGQPVWELGWAVVPECQGRGIATAATMLVLDRARADGTHRFAYAHPSVENDASNGVCRKAGLTLAGEADVEYPKGVFMRSNVWRADLLG